MRRAGSFVLLLALCTACGGGGVPVGRGAGTPDATDVVSLPDVAGPDDPGAGDLADDASPDAAPPDAPVVDVPPPDVLAPLVLSGVAPGKGLSAGGEAVVLAGDGFLPGMAVLFDVSASPAVTVASQQAATVNTPPHPPGPVRVTVVRPDGASASLEAAFTYANPVTVASVTPDRVPLEGGVPVTVRGSGFLGGARVLVDGRLAPMTSVVDDATLTVVVPDGDEGPADVVVATPSAQAALPGGLHYVEPVAIALVVPAAGPVEGGTQVAVTGAGFYPGTRVRFGAAEAAAVAVDDLHALRATTPPAAAPGTVDVTIESPWSAATLPGAFRYAAPGEAAGPVRVLGVAPSHGPAAGGNRVAVRVAGLPETGDPTVRFGATGAAVVQTLAAALTVVVDVPAGPPGPVDVSVTAPGGSDTLAGGYTRDAGLAVTGVSPASGPAAGGTAVVIDGSGFAAGATVRVGALPATAVHVVSPDRIEAVTPPGPPGPAAVRVAAGGLEATAPGAFVYDAPTALYALSPDQGATSGGTLVRLHGAGLPADARFFFGAAEASHVVVESPTEATCRTPPGPVGPVDVRMAADGVDHVLPGRFTYFDPTALYGGTWGSPVDGTLNITVLDTQMTPVPDAYVLVWTDPKTPYQGYTDPQGVVTFSGPDLKGRQMVTATKDCYSGASVVAFDAANVTLFLSYVCSQGGGGGGGGDPGIVTGKVIGLDKYVIPPPGDCWMLGTGPDGVSCRYCWLGDDCGEGYACIPINDDGTFCSKTCTTQADCPDGYACVKAASGGVQCLPQAGKKVAKCRGTQADIFSENQQPLPWAEADADSRYEVIVRPGTSAVVCVGGIQDPVDETLFRPYAMGVARHVYASAGQETAGVNVPLTVPMDRSFRIWLQDPPVENGGPDINAILLFYDFASDGVIQQDWTLPYSFGESQVTAENQPRAWTGDLYDASYTFMAGCFTLDPLLYQLTTPYSMALVKGVTDLADDTMFRLDGGTWSVARTGVRTDVWGLWGAAPDDVFAVGQDGFVAHWDGFGFTRQPLPGVTAPLRGVGGSGHDEAFAVGDSGIVLRFDGTGWQQVDVPAASYQYLRSVSCHAKGDCFAVASGFAMHWDGTAWTGVPGLPWLDLQAVAATGPGEAVAVGSGGAALRLTPSQATVEPTGATGTLRAIARTAAGELWAAGDAGALALRSGGTWTPVASGTTRNLYAVAPAGSRAWAFGDAGVLVRLEDGAAEATRIEGYAPQLRAAYGDPDGGLVLAMGVSQLLVGPFLPAPHAVHPADGGELDGLHLDWNALPEPPAAVQQLVIAIPTFLGDIPVWSLHVKGDVFHVDLPDVETIEGTPGIPHGTPLKLSIFRFYKPGWSVDHFDVTDLSQDTLRSWSVEVVNFTRP